MSTAEERWLAATTWTDVWWHVEAKRRARKLRLFGCACCDRLGHLLGDERSRAAVRAGEAYADGLIEKAALFAARDAAKAAARELGQGIPAPGRVSAAVAAEMTAHATFQDAFSMAAAHAADAARDAGLRPRAAEEVEQLALLRDILANPFRPAAFDLTWRTESVVGLALVMYESRGFGPMPVLADALEDAGCADADVLAHCRGSGPHVRGCWVVDLVLGKS